jgi:carnitine O-acetyltransferase
MAQKTFSNQSKLPRLPIPSLEETLARYLRSLEPLCSPSDLSRTSSYIADFLKPNGLGRFLQQRLIDLDRTSPHNWLNDSLWMKKAYHEWRESVAVNSNWYLLFADDPSTPRECFEINDGKRQKGAFGEWQVKRAAHLILQILKYKELIDR